MKRGFLIYGGESSGCRWLTRLFLSAGCLGDGDHFQRMNDQDTRLDFLGSESNIVWRHSVPEAHEWPTAASHVEILRSSGREVMAFVIVRDWWPMAHSQVARGHVENAESSFKNLQRAYSATLRSLVECECPFHMVTYEAFLLHPDETVRATMKMANLPIPPEYEQPIDQNAKWYENLANKENLPV